MPYTSYEMDWVVILLSVSDAHRFEQLKVLLKSIGLSRWHVPQTCQLIAAILHLGNLEFTIDRSRGVDAAVVRNADALALAAEFLGVQPSTLDLETTLLQD